MSIGYPDYQRLSRSGGFLLYGQSNVTPPYDTALFQGYIGLWPYLNVALSIGASADTVEIVINYYSDDTFTHIVGFRNIIRQGGQFSATQYANLSEWCQVFYVTKSGNPILFASFAVYAASESANQIQLVSTDVPVFLFNAAIAASGSSNIVPQHVQPGPAVLSVNMDPTTWQMQIQYYDYGSGTFLLLTRMTNTSVPPGGVCTIGLPDAPINVLLNNEDSIVHFMRMSIVSIT